jgi:hypothetical protein
VKAGNRPHDLLHDRTLNISGTEDQGSGIGLLTSASNLTSDEVQPPDSLRLMPNPLRLIFVPCFATRPDLLQALHYAVSSPSVQILGKRPRRARSRSG